MSLAPMPSQVMRTDKGMGSPVGGYLIGDAKVSTVLIKYCGHVEKHSRKSEQTQ